jgi:hypothetical protein
MKCVLTLALAAFAPVAVWQIVAVNSQAAMSSDADPSPYAESVQQSLAIGRVDLVPMAFTENQGQWDERVRFRANTGGATLWFTTDGVYHQFTRRVPKDAPSADRPVHMPLERFDRGPDNIEQLVIKASFVGVNSNVEVVGEGLMEYSCNYFIDNDPSKWYTDVPNYASVLFKDVYPNIDLRYYGIGNGRAACEFIAAPGADMEQIKVEYEGTNELSVDASGRLAALTGWGGA